MSIRKLAIFLLLSIFISVEAFMPLFCGKSRLFLDVTDVRELKELLPTGIIRGIATNPTLLERAGQACTVNEQCGPQQQTSRDDFLRILQRGGAAALALAAMHPAEVRAFNGGVGGLGKTKPETGVELFDETYAPIQNNKGIVSAEIRGRDGSPILVSFQSPWPLLPTSGALEARDIRSTESAFVQVVPTSTGAKWNEKKEFQNVLMSSVFAAQGKFGAYGQPFDIQVKRIPDVEGSQASFFGVTFTTLTPAMRESERKAVIAAKQIGTDTLVLLVITTTNARYASNEKTFRNISSSFEAIAAPQSSLKKGP